MGYQAIRPLRLATVVAGVYLVCGIAYIIVSSHMAAAKVFSKEQLENIETYKGTLFIVITALLLFTGLFILLKRLHRKECELGEQRAAIIAAGKQAVAGLFASSIAHDLNNILLVNGFAIEMLSKSDVLSVADRGHLDRLQQVHRQIERYAQRLVDVSGKHLSSGIRKADMAAEIDGALRLAKTHQKVKRCQFEVELPDACPAAFDAELLQRALLNLVVNAAEASVHDGRIRVKLIEANDHVRLEVHDNGPGISPEDRDRVLEPFYTTKSDGTGLGLLSLRYCADVHGGSIAIDASPLGGACVGITFPRGGKHVPGPEKPCNPASVAGRRGQKR
ncbi:hypothetical protein JCM12296A_20250 [Desulfosarcina cetonica]